MEDFLFHKVSEEEKQEIKKQAKDIMDSFSKKISSLDEEIPENLIKRETGERQEGGKCKEDFSREIMFENAPNKNKDFILGEKKKW
jgi:Asp-tRNA(Asn)/Glu-tRNA(Gln) amidotransferase C subunit